MSKIIVKSFTSLSYLKKNPHYAKAKSGSLEDAKILVNEIMEGRNYSIGNGILLPVIAEEKSGLNKIPLAFAMYLSDENGNDIDINVLQSVRANHTGSVASNRIRKIDFRSLNDEDFKGKHYIIIDDHVTMGGTIASLASFIRSKGGEIDEVLSLTNTTKVIEENGVYDLSSKEDDVQELRKRFGDEVEKMIGMNYDELTSVQIKYLLKFRYIENLKKKLGIKISSSYYLTDEELENIHREFEFDYLSRLFDK